MIKGWGVTDKGAVRQQNQDAYHLEAPSGEQAVAVVCDGMGGARAGNIASTLAVDTFMEALGESHGAEDPGERLRVAAERANAAVFYRASIDAECQGMGTTMVAALVCGARVRVLNVGDSRCYRVTGEGIERVTRDHSVVEDLVERGEITPEEARQHPRKNLITRALGAEEEVRADLYQLELGEGDCLLLCSDGLSNAVTDQEMLYEILHGGPIEDCCQRLLQIALSRGASDNVTAVLLRYTSEKA